jgi:hypothetical protein
MVPVREIRELMFVPCLFHVDSFLHHMSADHRFNNNQRFCRVLEQAGKGLQVYADSFDGKKNYLNDKHNGLALGDVITTDALGLQSALNLKKEEAGTFKSV